MFVWAGSGVLIRQFCRGDLSAVEEPGMPLCQHCRPGRFTARTAPLPRALPEKVLLGGPFLSLFVGKE
eukprot:18727-Amphidinium_carterae.1